MSLLRQSFLLSLQQTVPQTLPNMEHLCRVPIQTRGMCCQLARPV